MTLSLGRRLILAAALVSGLWGPATVEAETGSLGRHQVRLGDTLFSLGRAYGVLPSAIAQANGLGPLAGLEIGQQLIIPAVPWPAPPAGPVSQPQFASPFPSRPATLGPGQSLVSGAGQPLPGAAQPAAAGRHVVQAGETLFSIGRAYGVLPSAIAAANGRALAGFLHAGQSLVIPAVPWTHIQPGPVTRPQIMSPVGFVAPSGVGWENVISASPFQPTVIAGTPGAAAPAPTAVAVNEPAPNGESATPAPSEAAPTAAPTAQPPIETPAPGGYPVPVNGTPGAGYPAP